MILRATHKVIKKIKSCDEETTTEEPSFLAEWFVNIFILERHGYYIFSESKSLYSIIHSSKGIISRNDLEHLATDVVFSIFKTYRDTLPVSLFENTCSEIFIHKTNNRRIVGSQNDLINMAQVEYENDDSCDFSKINTTPLSFLGFASPREKFCEELKNIILKYGCVDLDY